MHGLTQMAVERPELIRIISNIETCVIGFTRKEALEELELNGVKLCLYSPLYPSTYMTLVA
jgi:hypothetical protein